MVFNYESFEELMRREGLSVLGMALELAEHAYGKGKIPIEASWPIRPEKLNYWAHVARAKVRPEDMICGIVDIITLAEYENSGIQRLLREDMVFAPPQAGEKNLIENFARARGHRDIKFNMCPNPSE